MFVHLGMDLQPLPCRSSGNRSEDHLQTGERLPAPILAEVLAARKLGMEEIPVIVLRRLSEAQRVRW
jgi:hypothetical protein